jgi:hypothetical protein
MSTPPLSELLRRRRQLKERLTQTQTEIDSLDRLIFPRMMKIADAMEGVEPRRVRAPNPFRTDSRLFHTPEKIDPTSNRFVFGTDGDLHLVNGVTPSTDYLNIGSVAVAGMGGSIGEALSAGAKPGSGVVFATSCETAFKTPGSYTFLKPAAVKPVRHRLGDAVFEVLSMIGRPMKAGEIMRVLLKDRGIAVPGKQPINNLSAHLSNDERFLSTTDGWVIRPPSLLSEFQGPVSGEPNGPEDESEVPDPGSD